VTTAPPADAPRGLADEIRAVLLDYGGTLDGDAWHWFDHFRALYAAAGRPLDETALKAAFYAADEALAADPAVRSFGLTTMVETHVGLQLARLGIDDRVLFHRLVDGFVADTHRAWDRNQPLLRRLATRYRLGVVSNFYGNMPALLAEAGLGPFATVLDSALVGLRKPDPALYELAATRLVLPPGTVLHVGDSWDRDVVPARAIGMHAAWLAPADTAMPPAPGSVWRLRSLLDLGALLP
jgi:putative hydrolase of the HAD superfamily